MEILEFLQHQLRSSGQPTWRGDLLFRSRCAAATSTLLLYHVGSIVPRVTAVAFRGISYTLFQISSSILEHTWVTTTQHVW